MKSLFRLVMIGVVSAALSGCLPDSDLGTSSAQKEQSREAQASGLARSLTVVGTQTISAFIDPSNTGSPFIQALNAGNLSSMATQMVDLGALTGASMGPAASVVAAGYCGDNSADLKRSLVVWLTPSKDNRFSPKALGEGSTGSVMSKLAQITDPTSVGIADGGVVKMRDGATRSLGNCATAFNIPVGAPVMVFANLEKPAEMELTTTRTETRTKACPSGQTGTITERKVYNVNAKGQESVNQDWTMVADLCSNQLADVSTQAPVGQKTNLMGSMQGLLDNLDSGELKNALSNMSDKDCKSNTVTRTEVDPATGRKKTVSYNTCDATGDTQIDSIANMKTDILGEPRYETMIAACSASTLGITDVLTVTNVPNTGGVALTGNYSTTTWQPNNGAVYKRKVQDYQVTYPDGTTKVVTLRGVWEGSSLSCNRTENISFQVDDYTPDWASIGVDINNLILISNDGIGYTRTATVFGWADSAAMVPNSPSYSEWQKVFLGAQWEEKIVESIVCTNGLPGANIKSRIHTLLDYRRISTGAWQEAQTCGTCDESIEVRTQQCPANQTGVIKESRTFNAGRVCNVATNWTVVSNTCAPCGTPVNATCGTSNGTSIASAPTGNLCGDGSTPSVTGSGPWAWTCLGTYSGNNASCSAQIAPINGQCGSANGTTVTNAPNGNLCADGSMPAISGSGPWSWSCAGAHGGNSASCSAQKTVTLSCPTIGQGSCTGAAITRVPIGEVTNNNGVVGTPSAAEVETCANMGGTCIQAEAVLGRNGSGYTGQYKLFCHSGTSTTSYSTVNGSGTLACGSSAPVPVDGQCGSSNGTTTGGAPTNNLCGDGSTPAVNGSGPWTWSCAGSGGGNAASCSAQKSTSSCPWYEILLTGATANITDAAAKQLLCSKAGINNMTYCQISNYYHSQEDINGPRHRYEANICNTTPAPVNGSCGSANGTTVSSAPSGNLCADGSTPALSGSGPWGWSCAGSGGGNAASCSAQKTPEVTTVHGQCGPANNDTGGAVPSSGNLCSSGTASAVVMNEQKRYVWNCTGGGSPMGNTASCATQECVDDGTRTHLGSWVPPREWWGGPSAPPGDAYMDNCGEIYYTWCNQCS